MWAFPAHQVRSILFANMPHIQKRNALSERHVSMDMLSHIPGIEDVTGKPPQPKAKEQVSNNFRAREEASINLWNAGTPALNTCDGALQRLQDFYK